MFVNLISISDTRWMKKDKQNRELLTLKFYIDLNLIPFITLLL